MARQKRHHTVTHALLKGFSEREQVLTRDRKGMEFRQSTKNATVVADFYSFENDGSQDDAVEEWLAIEVENEFTKLLPGLREGEHPTVEMRPVIARFLATAVVRTRTARSYMDQIDQHTAGSIILHKLAEDLGWDLAKMTTPEIENLRSMCQQEWNLLPPSTDYRAGNLRTVVRESKRIEEELLTYVWSVARSQEPTFLIGDAPVLALDGQSRGWHGIVPKGATVFMPLSSRAVLVGEPHVFKRSFSANGLVEAVNTLTVREAYKQVFRHPVMPWPFGLRLSTQAPTLPTPSFKVARSDPGKPPTFPYTYPDMQDARRTVLLKHLKAVNIVE